MGNPFDIADLMVSMSEASDVDEALKLAKQRDIEAFKADLKELLAEEEACEDCKLTKEVSDTLLVPPVCFNHQIRRKTFLHFR